MKKGRFVDTTTTKLAEWTKKVGTKIKETAEALEVEFNDDGGGGGGQHRQYSHHQPRKGNGKGQFTNNVNDNRFAALQGASSASNSQSSFIEEGDEERDVFSSEKKVVNLVVNVFESATMFEEKQKLEKEFKEMQREREEFEAKMREMERRLEEEKTKRKKSVTTNAPPPTTPPTKKGTSKKKTDDDDADDDDGAAAPASPVVLAAAAAQSPSSLEIEMKAIKNVTQTLKNQLKERDERIAKMLEKEKEAKELNESLTQKNSQMQTSLEVLRKKQKENDAAKDRDMLETSELKDLKRMKEKQEKELEREKKMKEVAQKKYEKAHEDWLDVTTNQANEKKELLRLQKSEEVKTEKIETLEEQLLQTKLELEDFKHCRKERDNALQKLSEVREEIVDLKHEKSAYENNAEDLRLVNEAREVAEKALVEESKKTIDLERKLRELSEEKANNNSSNRDSHNNKKKKNTRNHDDPESASATPKQDDGKGRTTPFSSASSSIKSEETDRDKNKTAQGSHESSSTIADLKSEIAALKNQLETLSREKDDKIAVIDSDRAQLQRQLEEAKKTATKLIKEKLESIQTDFKRSAETHAKETGLLKEEIADLEEDRNEWKRKCEKARDETDLVRKRAREMLVEKEEELERALFNDGKATTTDGKISSIGRKAASGLTFLEEDDDDQQEQTEKKKNSSSKPPPREVTTTLSSSSESDFLYLKNILLQYLTTNERLVHERLVPVVTTLLKCSDEERAKVIAARVNMKPSSSGGSQPNTPTRSTGSGVRLFNAFFRT